MSIADLHPEHLIEKEDLSPEEQALLDAHLEKCAVCRFERRARDDFADELAVDPDMRYSGFLREVAAPKKIRSRARLAWLAAAAVLLLALSAIAGESVFRPLFVEKPAPPVPAARVNAPEPIFQPSPASAPFHVMPATTVFGTPPMAEETAQSIFDAENDARRHGDYDRAIALHSKLVTGFPHSREAQVSRVAIARVLLDRGDAQSALVGFDAYLHNGGGELEEDALVGRATALERLNRNNDAREAWQSLIATHPTSPYTTRAKMRMEALGR